MSDDPTVDLIAETLAQHRTTDTSVWDEQGIRVLHWQWRCGRCDWAGEPVRPGEDFGQRVAVARAVALRHEAEQVAEALRPGAPETTKEGAV